MSVHKCVDFFNYCFKKEELLVLLKLHPFQSISEAYFNMATKRATFLNEKINVQKRATKRAIFTEKLATF